MVSQQLAVNASQVMLGRNTLHQKEEEEEKKNEEEEKKEEEKKKEEEDQDKSTGMCKI